MIAKSQALAPDRLSTARSDVSCKLLIAFILLACVGTAYYTLPATPTSGDKLDRFRLSLADGSGADPQDSGQKTAAAVAPAIASNRTIFNFDLASLDDLAAKIQRKVNRTSECNAVPFGSGWGEHTLCTPKNLTKPCYFYSFGISHDYSFDKAVAQKLGCYGFLADPTAAHPAKLGEGLTFHYMAAKSYHQADNQRWMFYTSMPGLRKFLRHDRVAVLKMDCEGCEYSLAWDILEEDPRFLHHIDQFAVEVHYSRRWLRGREELYSFAALLWLLKEAGLELIEVHNTECKAYDQATGLVPELERRKVQMALNGPNGESVYGKYGHCHNYLFARL